MKQIFFWILINQKLNQEDMPLDMPVWPQLELELDLELDPLLSLLMNLYLSSNTADCQKLTGKHCIRRGSDDSDGSPS